MRSPVSTPGALACHTIELQGWLPDTASSVEFPVSPPRRTGTERASSHGGGEMQGVPRSHHAGLWLYTMVVLVFTFLLLSQLL